MLKRTLDIASQIVISETVIDLVGVVRSFLEHGGDGGGRCVHQKLSVAPVAVQNTRETPKGVPLERLGEDVGNLILRADSHQLNFSCQHHIAAVVVVLLLIMAVVAAGVVSVVVVALVVAVVVVLLFVVVVVVVVVVE